MSNETPLTRDSQYENRVVYRTKDYGQFRTILGNRPIDKRHVNDMKKRILKYGNMTDIFPVMVNDNLEVIDGQHRLRALEELKESVCYVIIPHTSISAVRVLNTGSRTWNWHDRAASFAEEGNKNYRRFLQLIEEFPNLRYTTMLYYVVQGRARTTFNEGDLQVPEELVPFIQRMARQYTELSELSNHSSSSFAIAAFRFMRNPSYDHNLMKEKMLEYGEAVNRCYSVSDYLNTLENIMNAR